MRALPPPVARGLVWVLLALGCASTEPPDEASGASAADRDRFVRGALQDARALRAEGRLEHAESVLRRGLRAAPQEAKLHYALGRVLTDLGRTDEAEEHLRSADRIAPPPPLPPDTPLSGSRGLLIVLVPPEPGREAPGRVPADWPRGGISALLEQRLQKRLPDARQVHASVESVAEARAVVQRHPARAVTSLRVDRAYCAETRKDGPFAVAWLRTAVQLPGSPEAHVETFREVVMNPRAPGGCRREALSRALERVLASEAMRRAREAPSSGGRPYATLQLRALFPGISRGIEAELAEGRVLLAAGRVSDATAAFRRAVALDPEDPNARAYLGEAEATLTIVRELGGEHVAAASGPELDPRLSEAQKAAAEALLAAAQRRRDDLLAALAVLDEDLRAPPAPTHARLRRSEVVDADGFGPTLARERAGGDVTARAAYSPEGVLIARYYFPASIGDGDGDGDADGLEPVLREEDTNHDGRANRWIGYEDAARREIWEDGRARGTPDRHFVFSAGGSPLERIEVDSSGDGHTDRVFRYAKGSLVGEERDTNGDGRIDVFDRLDEDGAVQLREEDLDGDGEIDVRSEYRGGKLVRRELRDPSLLEDI